MVMQYKKFLLSPGQKPPEGATGIALRDGWVVWEGEENTFNGYATFGTILTTDPEPSSKIESYIMIQEEIDEYFNPTTSGIE